MFYVIGLLTYAVHIVAKFYKVPYSTNI